MNTSSDPSDAKMRAKRLDFTMPMQLRILDWLIYPKHYISETNTHL